MSLCTCDKKVEVISCGCKDCKITKKRSKMQKKMCHHKLLMIVHPPTLIRANFVFLYFVFLPFITETLSLKGERQRIIIWLNLISHHRTFGRDGLPLQWVCKDFCKGSRSCHPPSKSSWQTILLLRNVSCHQCRLHKPQQSHESA